MITERSNHIIPCLKRLRRRSSSLRDAARTLRTGFQSDRLRRAGTPSHNLKLDDETKY
ncbi:hypothetical protein GJB62_05265 [Nostoc sp. ATCC 53789]|uniref:hypothetical protein n=1 Tax=Nostoc sp. ATCC 53789 TaxID=76335 RepID=UPI00132E80F1|nr:hypothetical protein [Nostoc sp. ATCC 53789]QHG15434.1 hypothetical protein GJB62_05265 [Nostoc sp. ATCC 53789]